MHMGIADNVLITQAHSAASQTSVQNGAAVDMQGWDGVAFVINVGTMAAGATLDAYLARDDNSGFNSSTNIANAAITQLANTSNANMAILEAWRPAERYVRAVVTPAVGAVVFGVTAIRYRRSGGILPPTQTAAEHIKIAEN